MYNDADIEMMEAEAAANEAAALGRAATHEPTDEDLELVRSAAFHAAYYFSPVFESVLQVCADQGIDPSHEDVQRVSFEGASDAHGLE